MTATQLYSPYGTVRYSSGTLPTDYAFTHQRADATSGLAYYGARFYDPIAGQFISADTTLAGGLNRYAYVGGNPETRTDPTGHRYTCPTSGCAAGERNSGDGNAGSDSRRPGVGSGVRPRGCTEIGYQCQIDSTLHNKDTQKVLEFIANSGSKIGIELLQFLLLVGAQVGGDNYILWKSAGEISKEVGQGAFGGTDAWTGVISLSHTMIGDDPTLREAAADLIHEATESYFVIERSAHYGDMGTQRGDYIAEWFVGEFESEARNASGSNDYARDNGPASDPTTQDLYYRAYGLPFDQWRKTQDFTGGNYAKEGSNTWPILLPFVPGFSGTQWVGLHNISDLDQKARDLFDL